MWGEDEKGEGDDCCLSSISTTLYPASMRRGCELLVRGARWGVPLVIAVHQFLSKGLGMRVAIGSICS